MYRFVISGKATTSTDAVNMKITIQQHFQNLKGPEQNITKMADNMLPCDVLTKASTTPEERSMNNLSNYQKLVSKNRAEICRCPQI